MSGGYFDYAQYRINDIIDSLERLVEDSDGCNELVDCIGEDGHSSRFMEMMIKDYIKKGREFAVFVHRLDWLLSDDDGFNTFLERLEDDLSNLNKET